MKDCNKCEYTMDDGACGAFECNEINCPILPCEGWWIFTFGSGHRYEGRYVKIRGTFEQARAKMIGKYGLEWAFQYSDDNWNKMVNDPKRWWPIEKELEVIDEAD